MGNKLYVANLAFHLTENEIQDIFSPVGTVQEVKLILDKVTGKSRGFAFVTFASDGEAERAITEFNGHRVEGRPLAVIEARPREDRPPGSRPPQSGGGGGGGFSRPAPSGPAPATGSTGFGPNRPPQGGGGRPGTGRDGTDSRGGGPRREKEKPRGPRPYRNFDEED